ncbi:hypothetical protein P872_12875 [Rhodonellum psychrophilum GCM71 = DSM 17998]|uniref:Uncharacterized protein n=1 Tax=Rhodonellum psychrophilum GCM71 = DSM 17998 TaxID=1123057 RepID=U5BSN6_9BACT|nr:hypothetical protein P872_12875 [Rhodonellum psychrophilum GCM71 = DSM 17998]
MKICSNARDSLYILLAQSLHLISYLLQFQFFKIKINSLISNSFPWYLIGPVVHRLFLDSSVG